MVARAGSVSLLRRKKERKTIQKERNLYRKKERKDDRPTHRRTTTKRHKKQSLKVLKSDGRDLIDKRRASQLGAMASTLACSSCLGGWPEGEVICFAPR